jgi:hypothetical protein
MINAQSHLSQGSSPILESLALHPLRNRDAILQRTTAVARANLASLTTFMGEVGNVLDWVPP